MCKPIRADALLYLGLFLGLADCCHLAIAVTYPTTISVMNNTPSFIGEPEKGRKDVILISVTQKTGTQII